MIKDICSDCSQILGSCSQCSQTTSGQYQCNSCTDGFYLLRTTDQSGDVSFCVTDCQSYAYNFVNNPNTMMCEFCGDGCLECSPKIGCLNSKNVDHGYRNQPATQYPTKSGLYSSQAPSLNFKTPSRCIDQRCDKCQSFDSVNGTLPYKICDSCFQYVNFYSIDKQNSLNCSLCKNNQIQNCNTCNPDFPNLCLSCNDGYYLNTSTIAQKQSNYIIVTTCNRCPTNVTVAGCKRCNQTQCLECYPGYALTALGGCLKCDLSEFNSQYQYQNDRCSQCTPDSATSCQYCDQGFLGSLGNENSCELKCADGQYPYVSFTNVNNNENVILSTECQMCDKSCGTCVGNLSTQCLTCTFDTQYLQILNYSSQIGSCQTKKTPTATNYEIFVTSKQPLDAITLIQQSDIGNWTNPFWDFQFALIRAQELAVQYSSTITITIYLFKGDHYAIRNLQDTQLIYWPLNFKPNSNLNYKLIVKPLPCTGFTSYNVTSDICTDGDITIFNKNRELFYIEVPVSLNMEHIIIDSLDSVLYSSQSSCLQARQKCCQILSDTELTSLDGSTVCEDALQSYLNSTESKCLVNYPRSMFKLELNINQEVKLPNALIFNYVTIQNMFYALNSLISFTPIQGYVTIQNSKFTRLNICGSIIKNYYYEVQPDVLGGTNYLYLTDLQRKYINSIQKSQSYNSNPAGQSCNSSCYSLLIFSSEFSQIPYRMNKVNAFQRVAAENGMQYQAYIVNLNKFDGPISIQNSTFKQNKIPYSTCTPEIPAISRNINNFNQLYSTTANFDKVQKGSLIRVQNSGSVLIVNNTFDYNVMTAGLVIIDSATVLNISTNAFTQNSAIMNQNVLLIRSCVPTLSSNTFTNNSGCETTNLMTVQFVTSNYDSVFDQFLLGDNETPQIDSTIILENSIFTGNIVGKDQHLVSIEGFEQVLITDSVFIQNENYLPQSFNALSQITLTNKPTDVSTLDYYEIKAKSIMRIACSSKVSLNNITFQNNWVNDHQSYKDDYQSNAILIQNVQGTLSMTSISFNGNRGVSGSQYAALKQDIQGFRSSLIVFKDSNITLLAFYSISFYQNFLFYSTETEIVLPTLFSLTSAFLNSEVQLSTLSISQNFATNAPYIVYINLPSYTIQDFKIQYNNANSIFKIDIPTSSNLDRILLKNGNVDYNQLSNGVVFLISEANGIIFELPDKLYPNEPDTWKFTFSKVKFVSNQLITNIGYTSCVQITKSIDRIYPWLSLKFDQCIFQSNQGEVTSALYFAQSFVNWLVMESCNFNVTTTKLTKGRLAQVIYKSDPYSYLKIINSVFSCENIYDSSIIMEYNQTLVDGRPSLFRISQQTIQKLAKLDLNNKKNNGTLYQSNFKNIFIGNTYYYCNQVNKGGVYYLEDGAQVIDIGSSYQYISALQGGIAFVDGDGTYLTIQAPILVKNIYAYNGAIVFVQNGATAQLYQNIVISFTKSYEGTIAYLTQRGRLVLNQAEISNCIASKGGLIYLSTGGQFWISDVQFSNSQANLKAAIINIEDGREQYHLVDGSIRESYGNNYTLINYLGDCQITKTTIENGGRLISVTEASLIVNNTSIYDNTQVYSDNFGIQLYSAYLQVLNSSFIGQNINSWYQNINQTKLQEIQGTFIAAFGQSTVRIDSTSFRYGRATYGGCIGLFGNTNTQISNCSFTQCYAMIGGAIYATEFSVLSITKSTKFQNNVAYQGYGQNIYAVGGTSQFILSDSTIFSYTNSVFLSSASILILNTQFIYASSSFPGLNLQNGGGIYIQWGQQISIFQCKFLQLKAVNGGAIFFQQLPDNTISSLKQKTNLKYKLEIDSNTFDGCQASLNGGSIYFNNIQDGIISKSKFDNSKANNYGGAIYFWCEPMTVQQQQILPVLCNLTLNSLTFTNCNATQGGGLFWNFVEPNIQKVKGNEKLSNFGKNFFTYQSLNFTNCNAIAFGPQIAAPAQELAQIDNSTYYDYYDQLSLKRQLVLPFQKRMNVTVQKPLLSNYIYADVQSGGDIPPTWFALIDKYSQVVQPYSGGQITYKLADTKYQKNSLFTTNITGMKEFYSMFGLYSMDGMGVVSQPGINITVKLTVNAIDLSVPTTRQYLNYSLSDRLFGDNLTTNSMYYVSITMVVRDCMIGEGLRASGACFTCPSGTFLLEIPKKATDCQICQVEQSICLGGSDIGPKPDYWRLNNHTYLFIPCKEKGQCLGKDKTLLKDEPGNAVGLCAVEQGYSGVLCSQCLPSYKRTGTFKCSKCTNLEPLYTGLAFVLLSVGLCLLINSTIKGAASSNNTHSVFTKILMNHMQMLLITASFDMNWPDDITAIFQLAAPVQQVTSAITSFDCYMDRREPTAIDPYNFYADPYEFRIIYEKLLIMAIMPIFLTILSYVVWYTILRIKRRLEELQTKFIASLVMLLFLVHPSVTQNLINMFNCTDIDGELRLKIDLQVTCYEGLHFYMAYYVAIPFLILWGLGIPVIVFFMMRKDVNKLDTIAVKQKFGFLYNGYKRHNYYWEIVIMYRKICCIFVAVILNRVGIIVQALILLILLVLFTQANANNRPFTERALNDIESLSLATQIVTIYCGIFFISSKDPSSISFDKNRDFAITPAAKSFFFIIIAASNISFLVYWLFKFISVVRILIKESYPRIYVILFLCGRSDKMGLETAKRARDTKKEAIIESIETVALMMNKMKSLYINDLFYQDHNRFLRLLYYIESERQQIDLTQKVHNYYIQGQMARHRKFDPEIVKEAKDLREVDVQDNFFQEKDQIKVKPTQSLGKVHIEMSPGLNDRDSELQRSQFILIKHNQSGQGTDLLDIPLEDLGKPPSGKEVKEKKRKRKKNQQDLDAIYKNSRNAFVAIKTENTSRSKDVSLIDLKQAQLPEFLRGFQNDQEESFKGELKTIEEEQLNEKLFYMRQLTNRLFDQNESPQKSSPKKLKEQKTGISRGESRTDGTQTRIDNESQDRVSQDLQPFDSKQDENIQLRQGQLKPTEVTVIRGTGGQFAPQEEETKQEYRKRPQNAIRHELIGDQIVAIDYGLAGDFEDELKISIMDDDGEFVTKKSTQIPAKVITQPKLQRSFIPPIQPRQVEKVVDDTESFHTDLSMKDFDIMQEEQKPEFYVPPRRSSTKDNIINISDATPRMGEGLTNVFHPSLQPGQLFDSELRKSEDEDEESQNSRRAFMSRNIPNLATKSRN